MARVKSKKYVGVYLNRLVDGDTSYSVNYKDANGKKAWATIGKKSNGITEKFAYGKRAEFINKVKNGIDPLEHKKKRNTVTLDDVANVYFDDKAGINKTNDRQKGKYELHIKPVLGKKDIHTITKDNVLALQKALKANGRAPKTTNGIIALVKAAINHSIKEKNLRLINPCVGISPLKEDDKRERYLALDEVKQLLDEIYENKELYHFAKMALTTGGRLESILHIQKKDINLNANSVTIVDLKNGGTYTGFYDDEYNVEIKSHIKHLKANDYYVGKQPKPIPGRTMRRWLKPILDRLFNAGLEVDDTKNRVVIHTLRHTFASQLAIANVPILTIKNLMHHADIEQTMRYAKLSPSQGKEAVQGLYK